MTKSFLRTPNPVRPGQRAVEIVVDYLVIVGYLLAVAAVAVPAYYLFNGGLPAVSMWESQAISFVASVAPVILIFAHLDFGRARGTIGKRAAKLKVVYETESYWRSLVRNCVKFLPWQLAHFGVIDGVYTNFESAAAQWFIYGALGLAAILVLMMLVRPDKRQLGDLLAGTQVVPRQV